MKIPPGATSFAPPATPVGAGSIRGGALRHTFRPTGSNDWLLIYTLAGSGLYRFPGGQYRTRPHDITLYPAGIFQDYQIAPGTGKWDILFVHFLPRPDWLPWLNWPELSPNLMILSIADPAIRRRIVHRLREIIRIHPGPQSRSQTFAQNALEEVLLWCDSINPRQPAAQLDPRIRKAIDFLTTHSAEPFSEQRLARAAGLSPSRLRHLFRLQTGDSPRRFQETQRLRRAKELLILSRQTIAEIAHELGFASPFYFTLRFKKETAQSPRAFRQKALRKTP